MLYYLAAIGLIAHTYFWGLGFSWLIVPRIWRRWSWMLAPGLGWALQSAVVWAGAHTDLAGTNAYAAWSELLPAGLLAVAVWCRAARRPRGTFGLILVTMAVGIGWISPLTVSGDGLTSSSLGSSDPADYAAGARVFQEYSRGNRSGFLGQAEVTQVRSTKYFFDFWLRLNHFTPSALLAHNAAVMRVEPFRLVSVTAVVVLLLNLPLVLWLARIATGIRGGWLLALVALFGLSPINAYAVYHGALGQLYAAQGIGLLTIAVIGADRSSRGSGGHWQFLPMTLAAFWLLAGSYNFIMVVCLAPATALLLATAWLRGDWAPVRRVAILIAAGLATCVVFFWGRFDGLVERFSLFAEHDFGWPVPLVTPEGWLGLTRDAELHAWPVLTRIALMAGVLGLTGAGLRIMWRGQRMQALTGLGLIGPILFGWGILAVETLVRRNSSYDAYKLIAVFLPGLMIGLTCWLNAARNSRPVLRTAAAILVGALLAANVAATTDFRERMDRPALRVYRDLADLRRLEEDERFTSFNVMSRDVWTRLWANSFLLRKRQYFPGATYEGRRRTRLMGEWNLRDNLIKVVPPREQDYVALNGGFHLVRASADDRVQAGFGTGWYPVEHVSATSWRWSGPRGQILLNNRGPAPVRADLTLHGRGFVAGQLSVLLGEAEVAQAPVGILITDIKVRSLRIPSGRSILTLASNAGSERVDAGPAQGEMDRKLGYALYGFELQLLGAAR